MTADIEIVSRSAPAFDLLGRTLRRYAIFIILAALIVFFHFAEPAFLRVSNLFSVLQSVAVVALLAVGVTVTLAVDGFDLSIGSIAAFTLMVSSYAMVVWQLGAVATVGFALATGALIGAVNGLLIVGVAHSRPPRNARHDVPARWAGTDPKRRTLDHNRAHSI